MQQHALRVGQQHDAVAALDLHVQESHRRPGVRHQRASAVQ